MGKAEKWEKSEGKREKERGEKGKGKRTSAKQYENKHSTCDLVAKQEAVQHM